MTNRPRALVLAPQPFFTPRGTPFSVYYRTLVMAELGVDVDLLTYGEGQDVVIDHVQTIRIPAIRLFGPVKTGPSLKKALLDVLMVAWTVGLLMRRRYEFVHAHEEAVFWARFLKPIFRYKLIYDMHSSLPEQLANFSFSSSRVLKWLFEKLERTSVNAAEAVITICPALASYATGLLGEASGKHHLIENSVFEPVNFADHVVSSDAQQPLNLPGSDTRWIVYAGTLENYQGIDMLLEGFAQSVVPDDLMLVIAGGEPEQIQRFSTLADELSISSRVFFTGRVPPDVARQLNKQAFMLVSPRSTGTNTPLKIYEQLASDVPLLATRIYSHTQVLDDGCAMLVDPDAASIAQGIRELAEDDSMRTRLVQNALSKYRTHYSREAYTAKLAAVLRSITPLHLDDVATRPD